ncbi:hypothetical protein ACFLZZ_00665 [Nanoarchaeota archaeon]
MGNPRDKKKRDMYRTSKERNEDDAKEKPTGVKEQSAPLRVVQVTNALINHPDFPKIYKIANLIPDRGNKWAYLLRTINEEIVEGYSVAQANDMETRQKLQGCGLEGLICPYLEGNWTLEEKRKSTIGHGLCYINREEIDTLCHGDYEHCNQFKGHAQQIALGYKEPTKFIRTKNPLKVPDVDIGEFNLRDFIQDLDDWWKQEGKYGENEEWDHSQTNAYGGLHPNRGEGGPYSGR